MAKISISGIAAGVGVGVVDLLLRKRGGKIGPISLTPLVGRAVIMGTGLAMQAFDWQAGIGREVTSASIPLLTQSLAEPVMGAATMTRASRVGGRYPAQPIESEFATVRLV